MPRSHRKANVHHDLGLGASENLPRRRDAQGTNKASEKKAAEADSGTCASDNWGEWARLLSREKPLAVSRPYFAASMPRGGHVDDAVAVKMGGSAALGQVLTVKRGEGAKICDVPLLVLGHKAIGFFAHGDHVTKLIAKKNRATGKYSSRPNLGLLKGGKGN